MEKINSNLTGIAVNLEAQLNKVKTEAGLLTSEVKSEDSIQNRI